MMVSWLPSKGSKKVDGLLLGDKNNDKVQAWNSLSCVFVIFLSQNAVQTSSLEHLEIISCLLSQTVPTSEMLLNIYTS